MYTTVCPWLTDSCTATSRGTPPALLLPAIGYSAGADFQVSSAEKPELSKILSVTSWSRSQCGLV